MECSQGTGEIWALWCKKDRDLCAAQLGKINKVVRYFYWFQPPNTGRIPAGLETLGKVSQWNSVLEHDKCRGSSFTSAGTKSFLPTSSLGPDIRVIIGVTEVLKYWSSHKPVSPYIVILSGGVRFAFKFNAILRRWAQSRMTRVTQITRISTAVLTPVMRQSNPTDLWTVTALLCIPNGGLWRCSTGVINVLRL